MHHALFEVGGSRIHTYSALMAFAVVTGLGLALWDGKRNGLRPADVIDAALWAIIGGILGARIEYVLLNLEFFREQPAGIVQIWQGGFAYHGGLLGGVLAVILVARLRSLPFWKLIDALTLGCSLSVTLGWAACLFGGCAFGKMGFGWLYFTWHDIFGVTASRFAVQPLAIGLSLILVIGMFLARDRLPFPGALFLLFLVVSGLIHFGVSFGRGDETLLWTGMRVDQWLALLQVALAAVIMVYRGLQLKSTELRDACS